MEALSERRLAELAALTRSPLRRVLLAGLLTVPWLAAGLAKAEPPIETAGRRSYSEDRAPCASFSPLRRPFFGDLHVHTVLSVDASTQGSRTRPSDAYRFAK